MNLETALSTNLPRTRSLGRFGIALSVGFRVQGLGLIWFRGSGFRVQVSVWGKGQKVKILQDAFRPTPVYGLDAFPLT